MKDDLQSVYDILRVQGREQDVPSREDILAADAERLPDAAGQSGRICSQNSSKGVFRPGGFPAVQFPYPQALSFVLPVREHRCTVSPLREAE